MGLVEDAVAVAASELSVVQTADALDVVIATEGLPIPLAVHRTGEYCVVFFITKQAEGNWRTDIVPVRDGEADGYSGGTGGIRRRSEVEPGRPFVEGKGVRSLDDGNVLLQADGVSADDIVRLRWKGNIVAEAAVAAHGYFVLAAVIPDEGDGGIVVEAVADQAAQ